MPRPKFIPLESFRQKYNHYPWLLEELAYTITKKLDPELPVTKAARAYLVAEAELNSALEKAGIELG